MLKLIKLMTSLGYENITEKGICAGITSMWIQAWLSGKEEEAKFIARLKKIIR
ncbi:Uncharacterised protein [Legionella hackeliae]|nr:Uncharacterised protein [Legionella hackeliae]